jgi:amino acid transporter
VGGSAAGVRGRVDLLPSISRLAEVVTFITSATVLSFGTGPLVWAALRKQLPITSGRSGFRAGHVIPVLAFFSSNVIVYWAGWNTNWKLFVAILLGLVLLAAYRRFSSRPPPEHGLARGRLVVPWLGASP